MIHEKTDKNTIYYTLTITPANEYNGSASLVYISDKPKVIDALEKVRMEKDEAAGLGMPNVYHRGQATIEDDMRRMMVDQQIARAGNQAASVRPTAIGEYTRYATIGPDCLHGISAEFTRDPVKAVADAMKERNVTLQPFQTAMANTNPYKMPDLSQPNIQAAMQMAYAGAGVRPELQTAVNEMARNGLDTAAEVPEFQRHYETELAAIATQHPEYGVNQRQLEAVVATALHWQKNKCGSDLRQQSVFSRIAQTYANDRDAAREMDQTLRTEKQATLDYSKDAVDEHLKQNGQLLDSHTAQGFRMAVNKRIDAATDIGVLSRADVQRVIAGVAREYEQGVRAYNDNRAGYNFANIADAADSVAMKLDNENRDEVSFDE